ncbi:MAG: hypothetical protein OHK0046_13730 [Anaerolineae bacterium]
MPAREAPVFPAYTTASTGAAGHTIEAPTHFAIQEASAEEVRAITLINDLRAQLGLNCLAENTSLSASARMHSQDMHDRGFFGFTNPDGLGPGERAAAAGYSSTIVGESITAAQDGLRDTAEETLADLRASRTNYFNLTASIYDAIGVGFFDGTLNFEDYWTIDLGAGANSPTTPCSASPLPITDVPQVSTATITNTLTPAFVWTRAVEITESRLIATAFDVEVIDLNNPLDPIVLAAPRASSGTLYAAESVCEGTQCFVQPFHYSRPLENGGTYQFWVRAYSPTGGFVWSAVGSTFTIDLSQPVTIPTLTAPLGTVEAPYGNPDYTWVGVESADKYELYVMNAAGEQAVHGVLDANRYCSGLQCAFRNAATQNEAFRLSSGDYSAYMRAYFDGLPGAWSAPFPFTITAPPPGVVALRGLTETNTELTRPAFVWTLDTPEARNASWFFAYIAPSDDLSSPAVQQWITRWEACGGPDGVVCVFQPDTDILSTASHDLYVTSWGPGGYAIDGLSGYAGPFAFAINAAPPAPPQVTPTFTDGTLAISFPDDPNTTWVRINVADAADTLASLWYRKENCINGLCEVVTNVVLQTGSYRLLVEALGPAGTTSAETTLTIDAPFPAVGDASLLSLTDTRNGRPELTWAAAENAAWYRLWIGTPDFQTIYTQWYPDDDLQCDAGESGTCTLIPDVFLLNGDYLWYVQSWGAGGLSTGGDSGWIPGAAFSVNAGFASVPQPITPTRTGSDAVQVFQWPHDVDHSWYEVVVGVGAAPGVQPLYNSWETARNLGCVADGICELYLPLETGNYAWSVRAYSPQGVGAWSAPRTFQIRLP